MGRARAHRDEWIIHPANVPALRAFCDTQRASWLEYVDGERHGLKNARTGDPTT